MEENASKKSMKMQAGMIIITIIAFLLAVSTATYAWFSFNPSTNVEPISSTVSDGDSSLLISNERAGPFDKTTTLRLTTNIDVLRPVSTVNLNKFYTSIGQDANGNSIFFKEDTKAMSELMHGYVYLKSLYGDNDVYFYKRGLEFGSDPQTRAALRLGLRITTAEGTEDFIIKLDSLVEGNVNAKLTVPNYNTVVAGVGENKSAVFAADPAENIGLYMAGEENGLSRAEKSLGFVKENEVATVEYWLYLEGCDEHCINDVESKNINLQLAFAGLTRAKNK